MAVQLLTELKKYYPHARMHPTKPVRYCIYKKAGEGFHHTSIRKMLFISKCELIGQWAGEYYRWRATNFHFSNSTLSYYFFINKTQYRISTHYPNKAFIGISIYLNWDTDIFEVINAIIFEAWQL